MPRAHLERKSHLLATISNPQGLLMLVVCSVAHAETWSTVQLGGTCILNLIFQSFDLLINVASNWKSCEFEVIFRF